MTAPIETGNPEVGVEGFRRALGEFATGVTVITTSVDGVCYGMTSNSFGSVSLRPPLVLWSIRRESQSFQAFEACTHFAVNVLAHDQMELSQRFARSGPKKFHGVAWQPGVGDAPVLADVAASFQCRRTQAHDGGDHLILLGQVENFCRYDRQPLLFSKGRYAMAADHPDARALSNPQDARLLTGIEDQLLSPLMVRAYSAIASQLEKGRKTAGLGLTLMQARLLRAAQTNPDRTLEELQPELLLDFNAGQDVLNTMVALGLLVVNERGKVRLTPAGEERIRSVLEHTSANEEILFGGIPREDVSTVQRVLRKLIEAQHLS
jgi:flavin reductase (DIM6/NTAB) family NADH-FMN oxidoreductase RutF/DNA-binding MarR family transcriptional regulator